MTCRACAPQLSPYAEGLLSGTASRLVAEHLLACRACRRVHDRIAAGVALAQRLPELPVGGGAPTWHELAPLLESPRPLRARMETWVRRWGAGWRWAFAASVATAFVLVVLTRGAPTGDALSRMALAAHKEARFEAPPGTWITAEGARAMPLGEAPLAGGGRAVGMRVDGQAVTLATWSGGESPGVAHASLVHDRPQIRREGALTVFTWSRQNRAFALVSALPGERACVVCHSPESLTAL